MKNIIFFVCSFISSISSAAEVAHLFIKNINYSMIINYQVCALPYQKNESFNCAPVVQNLLIKRGQNYATVEVDNWAFYVKVISAYQLEEDGIIRAYGEFDENECRAFTIMPIILLDDFKHEPIIKCKSIN